MGRETSFWGGGGGGGMSRQKPIYTQMVVGGHPKVHVVTHLTALLTKAVKTRYVYIKLGRPPYTLLVGNEVAVVHEPVLSEA